MATSGLAPRRAAHRLIARVIGEGRPISDLLPDALEGLPPTERARAQRLALDTLRWMDRADRLLGPHLKKMPDPTAMIALRMAVVEMAVYGAAPHGAVDAAVRLVKADRAAAHLSGLVNAVLRRVDIAGWDDLPVPRLPKKLRAAFQSAWGKAALAGIEAAHARGAPLDLTPRDGDAQALAGLLGGVVLPTGSVRVQGRVQVTALPGYADGMWWVQDAAAAVPARVLAPRTGERIADLCAAPGGKTMQLAAAGAEVTALDISELRMARMTENLARTRLTVTPVVADLLHWDAAGFDAVLLDAPCSATGTIRRHPDLPQARPGASYPDLVTLQARMLDKAADLVRPGGRLVYCTCSLLPVEGESQIAAFLERHRGFDVDHDALRCPGVDPAWVGREGLRLRPDHWPEQGGMDGFFVSMLRKAA